jgi:sec-independent protein translocase protein TatB
MSGIGTSELILLFVVGLLVLGPERLPKVASQLGRWVGRARREANRLRQQLERETRPDEPPQ